MGRSFNPRYLDLTAATPTDITDVVYDVGNNFALELGTAATTNVATEPNRIQPTNNRNLIQAYPAGVRRNGIAVIESQQALQAAVSRVAIPQGDRKL